MQNIPSRHFFHTSARDLFDLLVVIAFGAVVYLLRWHFGAE
jgi:hypothetical protein